MQIQILIFDLEKGSVQRRVTAWTQTALYLVMFFYSQSTRFINWFTFILVIFPFKFFKVHEGNPPPSHVIVSQLIWREFFYTMSANNPFYAEIFRKPALSKGCDCVLHKVHVPLNTFPLSSILAHQLKSSKSY